MNSPRRILIVSGIWPPDVGGPASHGPELGRFLARRGHDVTAVASVSETPVDPGFPLVTTSRHTALPVRWADAEAKIAKLARAADVIYATGLYHRSAFATLPARIPLIVKLVNDPAYERARNSGLFGGTLEDFQSAGGGVRSSVLKLLRNAMVARSRAVIVPSGYLAEIVRGWKVPHGKLSVIPNPAPEEVEKPPREELRRELGLSGPCIVFAGRFVLQKNLPMAVAAMRHVEDATLWLIGEGPERGRLQDDVARYGLNGRVRILPAVPRRVALRWMRAADVTVLSSAWENFPHAAVESLTVGTPVVATAVGGVPEIVEHRTNGLLVESDDSAALAEALRRALHEPEVRERLRQGAAAVGDRFSSSRLFEAAERVILAHTTRRKTGLD